MQVSCYSFPSNVFSLFLSNPYRILVRIVTDTGFRLFVFQIGRHRRPSVFAFRCSLIQSLILNVCARNTRRAHAAPPYDVKYM